MKECSEAGFKVLLLTISEQVPQALSEDFFISDYKTLISLNRSNGGATFFQNGELVRKWGRVAYPDMEELEDIYASDTTEISIAHDSKGSLAMQGFLLYVFAVLLLL